MTHSWLRISSLGFLAYIGLLTVSLFALEGLERVGVLTRAQAGTTANALAGVVVVVIALVVLAVPLSAFLLFWQLVVRR